MSIKQHLVEFYVFPENILTIKNYYIDTYLPICHFTAEVYKIVMINTIFFIAQIKLRLNLGEKYVSRNSKVV